MIIRKESQVRTNKLVINICSTPKKHKLMQNHAVNTLKTPTFFLEPIIDKDPRPKDRPSVKIALSATTTRTTSDNDCIPEHPALLTTNHTRVDPTPRVTSRLAQGHDCTIARAVGDCTLCLRTGYPESFLLMWIICLACLLALRGEVREA